MRPLMSLRSMQILCCTILPVDREICTPQLLQYMSALKELTIRPGKHKVGALGGEITTVCTLFGD
eukprot:jgi/Botrbrau1/2627/Bobra.145_1s0045.1